MMVWLTHGKTVGEASRNLRFIPPPPNIERFTFGYSETLADVLWLRVVQDIGVCENSKNGEAHGPNTPKVNAPQCKMGWVYQMIEAITKLSPNWRLPYASGAVLLSVVVDDIEGATKIFDRALAKFTNDYNLSYRAAYHYIWEVQNPERAANLLIVAAKNGGPTWFYALAGKLYSKAGQAELAKGVLERVLEETSETDPYRVRIQNRLDEANEILRTETNKK